MQIFIHRYQLKRKQQPNSVTTSLFQDGALIKVLDFQNQFGVADLCPWPSLGDQSLDHELQARGPLFQRALELAYTDYVARKNKVSLLKEGPVRNHILVSNYLEFDFAQAKNETVKIKGDRQFAKLAEKLNSVALDLKSIRLDFNYCLTFEDCQKFLALLMPETLKKIECIEDPIPFDLEQWQHLQSQVPLALDWGDKISWPYKIVKPAREKIPEHFLYMTSVMDHPVGVVHGLVAAQKFMERTHGFLTLDLYESTVFHKYFKQTGTALTLDTQGFGIGFDTEFAQIQWQPLIDWNVKGANQLLFNPKLSHDEITVLEKLKIHFDQKISSYGYFLIPSSGSSQSSKASVKLIALSKQAVLNSAQRVNTFFKLGQHLNWGCVLPSFHVGGLGLAARSHLSQGHIFFQDWRSFSAEWVLQNRIHILSLVPTQVYDLVQKKIKAPSCVKIIFVGGANLTSELAKQAAELGWPLIQTYGMTETASMIAIKESHTDGGFQVMPGVEIAVENGFMRVRCDSLAQCSLQQIENDILLTSLLDSEGWLNTSDQVSLVDQRLHFFGRESEYIKILGEGVSLAELRERLQTVLNQQDLPSHAMALVSFPDERRGSSLCLVAQRTDPKQIFATIDSYNLLVRPYEKINQIAEVMTIPLTELGKIKYNQVHELALKAGVRTIDENL